MSNGTAISTDVNMRSIWSNQDQHYTTYDGRSVTYSLQMFDSILGKSFLDAPQGEKATFLAYCVMNRLDPVRKQVHFVKYDRNAPASFVTSWEVFLERAQRSPHYDGMDAGIVWRITAGGKVRTKRGGACDYQEGPDHVIAGAWCHVFRKDRSRPHKVEMPMTEMMATMRDGTPVGMWKRSKITMALKTVKSRALRESFPEDLGSLYTEGESEKFSSDIIDAEVLKTGDTLPPDDLDKIAESLDDTPGEAEPVEPEPEPVEEEPGAEPPEPVDNAGTGTPVGKGATAEELEDWQRKAIEDEQREAEEFEQQRKKGGSNELLF